jgi:citrate lyase synthetase
MFRTGIGTKIVLNYLKKLELEVLHKSKKPANIVMNYNPMLAGYYFFS